MFMSLQKCSERSVNRKIIRPLTDTVAGFVILTLTYRKQVIETGVRVLFFISFKVAL